MPFERPLTIEEAVNNIRKRKFILPAIQREFVWESEQIECLFDSLMRDYPIGTFLLWYIEKGKSNDYQFYEFIKDYHKKESTHNPKASISGDEDVTAVLDGQQRLTAVYLGLKGTYSYKLKGKRWDNPLAYPKRKLYLNILSKSEDENLEYDFKFLTDEEARRSSPEVFWFRVGEILDFTAEVDVANFPNNTKIVELGGEKLKFATTTLFKLYTVLRKDPVFHYFLEKDEQIDKVLNIFIRVNSGGTPLSYSDLLLSIATAQWETRDAREEITKFVDEINTIGNGFDFNKDLVLKTCLVLSDFPKIGFKVENFNKENMLKIEADWDKISDAIRLAITLVSDFGYDRDLLTATNAIIPVAYYIYKKNNPYEIVSSSSYKSDRTRIHNWLIRSLLKGAFGGTPDTILSAIRQVIRNNDKEFPLNEIKEHFRGKVKSIIVDDDDIENILSTQYGRPLTFSVLSLLYPTLDFKNKFHQDHIYPKSFFKYQNLVSKFHDRYKCEFYSENFSCVLNLQLMEGVPNIEKSDKDFSEWLKENFESGAERRDYMKKHYIPDIDLSFDNFEEFIKQRKQLIIRALKERLE